MTDKKKGSKDILRDFLLKAIEEGIQAQAEKKSSPRVYGLRKTGKHFFR